MKNNSISIDVSKLDEMVEHYIDLKVKERREKYGTYNEAWINGEIEECKKWLKLFGVEFDYFTMEEMIKERIKNSQISLQIV